MKRINRPAGQDDLSEIAELQRQIWHLKRQVAGNDAVTALGLLFAVGWLVTMVADRVWNLGIHDWDVADCEALEDALCPVHARSWPC